MQHNPYTPPISVLEKPDAKPETSRARIKKTKSVWLLVIAAGFVTALMVFGVVSTTTYTISGRYSHLSGLQIAIGILGRFFVLLLAAGATYGTLQRTRYGRTLGLIFIFCVYLGMIYKDSSADLPQLISDDHARATGQILALAIINSYVLYWFYRFGFSDRAREYFQLVSTDEDDSLPPLKF